MQSQGTTPVTDQDVLDRDTWSTLEQVIWSELGKLKEQSQEIPTLYTLCEELHKNQKSQEKQILVLRNFARQVEQYLTQARSGAVAPREPMDTQEKEGVSVDGLRLSTPTNPQGAPPLGWRHDGVVCVVLEFQSGNAILAQVQGTCLG